MATATARKSKVYTISLPPELARKAEALARRDSRTMSELFREAFRTYSAQQARRTLDEQRSAARNRPRHHRGSDRRGESGPLCPAEDPVAEARGSRGQRGVGPAAPQILFRRTEKTGHRPCKMMAR